ncbi:winged helix-turn-helix domain-containing protein [Vibrio splendidus]|uniref:winged helix-turn-helix domain-containing protein n=1 Tax=Vibrio splendidus TaxID=29497 RepID=UPI002468BA32|nr:winged helix-turn-helix domain-containing protein [Vibrio splendidus]MDH5914169.1 winged helix-turn-helix domain-containing protein [Vibrio splendidus]MDH5941381.1 winged helix-turn-helix domain-containing protein [Vibrio splendidus]MDH5986586.1 winged helix-turn-helix domain-containing protein [Vibrio splendidus]MDH5992961.1 winged helix-turn-helix domain-containing protein [Vibrio splendidus]MDH6007329.1 winged helix-turn-helix domain-containing protein [Vibrio splendidus]
MKQQIYQICDASYDPLLRQFVREDGHVETIAPLEGKVFLFLLENAGECIERGLIFDRCWGNVIVSEQALTNVISKIRKTLSRVTCGCATIRTVSKTGYSLEIDELNRSTVTEEVPSQASKEVCELGVSLADSTLKQNVPLPQEISQDPLTINEALIDADSAKVVSSELPSESHLEQSAVKQEQANVVSNRHLAKAGYLLALVCVAVTAFNLFQTYYTPLPYFIDKAEYRDSYTDNTNHYFFHIAHNDSYSLPTVTQKLTAVIPSNCNVDVFVRIYPSVDQPEDDALYMLIQRKDGEALNYSASVFNVESSFDSFAQYMKKRSYFCD